MEPLEKDYDELQVYLSIEKVRRYASDCYEQLYREYTANDNELVKKSEKEDK